MQFKPNFDLLVDWNQTVRAKDFASNSAFIAVFKHDIKTLVYMCDIHSRNISFNMVDMCFSDDFEIKPDVLLTEIENTNYEHKFGWYGLQDNTLAYASVLAAKKKIPVVFSDLSDNQMIEVLKSGFPDKEITNEELHKALRAGPTNKDCNIYSQMCDYLGHIGRDRFMLDNIATALNKYNTVFVIFGAGHYEAQRLVLEDMMGKPEYITRIKNMRGDFSDVKISPIKLCDFKLKT